MERFRSKCYVAGGVFTKYNKKYENIFPIAFNYFSPKHDTDIYILHSTIFSSGILDSFRNQIIEEHDCQYDENIVTINKSIHKTVKLWYQPFVVNIIFLKENIKAIAQALEEFHFYFCKIYFEYSNKSVFTHYDIYRNYDNLAYQMNHVKSVH